MEENKAFIIIGLLLLSAFFSSSETALFSLPRVYLKKIEKTKGLSNRRVIKLLQKPRKLLITLLLGNTFVNMAISSFATLWALQILKDKLGNSLIITIQVVITTTVILVFGEMFPKLLALAKAESFSRIASVPLMILQYLLYPIIILFEGFSRLISTKRQIDNHIGLEFTSEEFHDLIQSENSVKSLKEHEKKMLAGLFRVREAEIKEIMVPRVHITAIEEKQSMEELKNLIVSSGYSRIPVFRETIDDIIGIVYVKDLLLFPEKASISKIFRPAWFVTENMKLQALLNQFKSRKLQVAIVVDEYGGTAGVITLEDILEEIVGEIRDEYDQDEIPEMIKHDDRHYTLSGLYNIRQFNQEFHAELDPDEFDNIAEFILAQLNHVPLEGESYELDNRYNFTIKSCDERSIKVIGLELIDTEDEG
ncbi:MAG: hemolysin family protein [Candidatus Cloacimonetes bacterium]|nr:hemolysin family protein [Candidatus Cloacimonadota bacterium]